MKKSAVAPVAMRRLAQMHEFRGAFAQHLNARARARVPRSQSSVRNPVGSPTMWARATSAKSARPTMRSIFFAAASLCDKPTQAISGMV